MVWTDITDSDIEKIHIQVKKKNTKKNEKSAEHQFCKYLSTQGADLDSWDMDPELLDTFLSKFWLTARQTKIDLKTQEPKKYMVQILRTIRYSLEGILNEKDTEMNIITKKKFGKSQKFCF